MRFEFRDAALSLSALTFTHLLSSAAAVDKSHCTLYMAPSSTAGSDDGGPEAAVVLGMYTGIDIEPGTTIGLPEVVIPIIDIDLHANDEQRKERFFEGQSDFSWTSITIHANFDIFPAPPGSPGANEGMGLLAMMPGIGSLANQHVTSHTNAEFNSESLLNRIPSAKSSASGDSASVLPNYGSSTQYHNMTLESLKFIPAGMEILVNNLGRESEDVVLDAKDYDDADEALRKINEFMQTKVNSIPSVSGEKKQEIYSYLLSTLHIAGTPGANFDAEYTESTMDAIAKIMPKNPSDVERIMNAGGLFREDYPDSFKSNEWLEENGQCLDGIYPGTSTIDAEKGAFATRDIPKKGLISPAPLLLIHDKEYLDMFPTTFKGERHMFASRLNQDRDGNTESPITQQLLINYCFSHPQSSLLFYPYGMTMNLINHKPTGQGANAKLVWTKASYHDNDLLEDDASYLKEEVDAVVALGMDVVATRDIGADEEIFLDYGPEWQQAFEVHAKGWDYDRVWATQAVELNRSQKELGPFLTAPERKEIVSRGEEDPVPENIMTGCFMSFEGEKDNEQLQPTGDVDGLPLFRFNEKETTHAGRHLRKCEVHDREKTEDDDDSRHHYMVYIYEDYLTREGFVENFPHDFITFVDRPYTSVSHSTDSFRHPIMIPSDIFPESWRDL